MKELIIASAVLATALLLVTGSIAATIWLVGVVFESPLVVLAVLLTVAIVIFAIASIYWEDITDGK